MAFLYAIAKKNPGVETYRNEFIAVKELKWQLGQKVVVIKNIDRTQRYHIQGAKKKEQVGVKEYKND